MAPEFTYPQPGDRRIVSLPGGLTLALAYVPAGTFWMGNDEGDANERPRHAVTLTRACWLGVTPVTQAQWRAVADGSDLPDAPSMAEGDDLPVESVTWFQVRAWCNLLSACLDHPVAYPCPEGEDVDHAAGFRLPTEAEWERACRAGTDTTWSFGDDGNDLFEHGWFDANSGDTEAVAGLAPNPWGLHDMYGNVWEWTEDGSAPYAEGPVTDPHVASGTFRVIRGGSSASSAARCSSACRDPIVAKTSSRRASGLAPARAPVDTPHAACSPYPAEHQSEAVVPPFRDHGVADEGMFEQGFRVALTA